jgi:hypothetical protein
LPFDITDVETELTIFADETDLRTTTQQDQTNEKETSQQASTANRARAMSSHTQAELSGKKVADLKVG